jgi:hypothetical protein
MRMSLGVVATNKSKYYMQIDMEGELRGLLLTDR